MESKTSSNCETFSEAQSESGMILLLFALVLSASVALVAMVVDHSKQSLALNQLQISADAAALSAAKRLNGRLDGWQEAKKAAVLAIKQSQIHGQTAATLAALALNQGEAFGDGTFSAHSGQTGSANGLEVTVRRGTYWWDPQQNRRVFRSLEEIQSGELFWVPLPVIANAVEVTLTIDSLATTFGRALGIASFNNLSRSSVAISDRVQPPRVAPFAIPICELLVNKSPYVNATTISDDHYNVVEQSKRTLLFTSADPDGTYLNPFQSSIDSAEQKRHREGFQRFLVNQSHVYINYQNGGGICYDSSKTGEFASCTHTPIRGVMGVPTTVAGQTASVGQIKTALQQQGQSAMLGQYFAPLENLSEFDTDADAVKALSDFIKGGQRTVSETYFASGAPKNNFHGVKKIRQTPCSNNSDDPEGRPCHNNDPFYTLRAGWPTELAGGTYQLKMLMDRRTGENPVTTRVPLDFTNPNCHMDELAIDDPDAPTQSAVAMVIAPSRTEFDNRPIKYCDPQAVFLNQGTLSAVPPVSDSHPVIVGYVPVHIHDGNVLDLDVKFAANGGTPTYSKNGRTIMDRAPGELDILHDPDDPLFKQIRESAKQYAEDYNQWHEQCDREDDDVLVEEDCDEDDRNLSLADIGGPQLGIPQELLDCFDFSPLFDHPQFGNILETMSAVNPKFLGYANSGNPLLGIPPSEPEFCLVREGDSSHQCIDDDRNHQMVQILDKFFDHNIKAKSFPTYKHCLPILKAGRTNWNDPANYDDLHSLKAGRGCGGLIGALGIESEIDHDQDPYLFATGDLWSRASPILVSSN